MTEQTPEAVFDTLTARLIQREALRRAAADLNTASPRGLETTLARISKQVTDEAEARRAATPPPESRPSRP